MIRLARMYLWLHRRWRRVVSRWNSAIRTVEHERWKAERLRTEAIMEQWEREQPRSTQA
jgi:hypothetical protein